MTDQSDPNPISGTSSNPSHEDVTKPPLTEFLEHQITAAQETIKALEALIPPDFRTHSRTARHEFLLSFKVLLDGAMTSVERELNKARNSGGDNPTAGTTNTSGPSTTGKTKVKVEVS